MQRKFGLIILIIPLFLFIFSVRLLFILYTGVTSEKTEIEIKGIDKDLLPYVNVSINTFRHKDIRVPCIISKSKWVITDEWIKRIYITYPADYESKINEIKIKIGNKTFVADKAELHILSINNSIESSIRVELPFRIRLLKGHRIFFHFINLSDYRYLLRRGITEGIALSLFIISLFLILNYGLGSLKKKYIYDKYSKPANIHVFIIFFLTFIIAAIFSFIKADYYNDGVVMNPALDVLKGKLLYRDTFSQYGALTVFLQSFAMLIFGRYLIVLRLLTALFYGLSGTMLYLVWTKFMSRNLAFVSALLLIFISPYFLIFRPYYTAPMLSWASVYAMLFQIISIYYLIRHEEQRGKLPQFKYIFYSGIFIGITFWFKQNVGYYQLIASIIILITLFILNKLKKKNDIPEPDEHSYKLTELSKELSLILAGFASISSIFIIYFIATGSLNDWYLQTFRYSYYWLEKFGKMNFNYNPNNSVAWLIYNHIKEMFGDKGTMLFNCLGTVFLVYNIFGNSMLWRLLPLICIVVFVKVIIRLIKSSNINLQHESDYSRYKVLFILMVYSLISWLQYFPISEFAHTYWAVAPMTGIVIFYLWNLCEIYFIKLNNNLRILKYILFAILVFVVFYKDIKLRIVSGCELITDNIINGRMIETPHLLKHIYTDTKQAEFLESFDSNLNNHTDKNCQLINMTNNLLFSSINRHINYFHPCYSYAYGFDVFPLLYPDYPAKLNDAIYNEKNVLITPMWHLDSNRLIIRANDKIVKYKVIGTYTEESFLLMQSED